MLAVVNPDCVASLLVSRYPAAQTRIDSPIIAIAAPIHHQTTELRAFHHKTLTRGGGERVIGARRLLSDTPHSPFTPTGAAAPDRSFAAAVTGGRAGSKPVRECDRSKSVNPPARCRSVPVGVPLSAAEPCRAVSFGAAASPQVLDRLLQSPGADLPDVSSM
jgi:hypothetical protein